jgi:hypothetical protein
VLRVVVREVPLLDLLNIMRFVPWLVLLQQHKQHTKTDLKPLPGLLLATTVLTNYRELALQHAFGFSQSGTVML